MFLLRNHKRRQSLPQIFEIDEERIDDSLYHSEAVNARLLLERLYELKLERDNLELRHKRAKCRYSEAVYTHLKISTALRVYSTFPLSFDDQKREPEPNGRDDLSQSARLRLIYEKYDDRFEKVCEKTWTNGGRGIELLVRMKKSLQEVLYAVESLVINGRL